MQNILELATKPLLLLKKDAEEVFTVEFPLSAVVAAEEKLGRSLKWVSDWYELKWTEVPTVLHAGLLKHHPEVTLETITAFCEELGAEGVLEVRHALICLNFPRTIQKVMSNTSPNVPSGGAQ
jgi:hypothetical protein